MKPRFITLEGGEGAGKTTNLEFIEQYLVHRGVSLVRTREPGGTALGEKIRGLLLASGSVDSCAELLLVFAARAQHINEVIRPALAAGHWVLCDRFTDSTYAYQGGGRGMDLGFIGLLEQWIQLDLNPDLTLLLDLPVQIGMARARGRAEVDRFETENDAFFNKVRMAYLDRLNVHPNRIKRIDASRGLQEVQADLAVQLDCLLEASA